MELRKIRDILGDQAALLEHQCKTIAASSLTLPSPSYIDDMLAHSDRTPRVLGALQQMMSHGRLANTGYLSILPVDQGIEHSAGASFAPNPQMFDPENIVQARDRGRLQRGRVDVRRARHRSRASTRTGSRSS